MAHTIAFDTLHNYERLRKVGFNEEQAKEQTEIISELVDNGIATKQDLNYGFALVQKDIKALETSLKKDIMWIKAIGGLFGSIILTALGILLSR